MKNKMNEIMKWRGSRCLFMLTFFSLLCGSVTGCGSKMNTYDAVDYATESVQDSAFDMSDTETGVAGTGSVEDADVIAAGESMHAEEKGGVSDTSAAAADKEEVQPSVTERTDNKKIIKRYCYNYETEAFDEAYSYLRKQIEEYDGYIASSSVEGTIYRMLRLTARIPVNSGDEFVGRLGSLGTVISQSESSEDVTLQYTDTESRIKSLKTEQERLNALLVKADNLDSIIALENRLTEVRYELENYQSQKNLYDDLITYSTVDIILHEVNYTVEVDDTSFISRISTGLRSSFRNIKMNFTDFLVWFIVSLPYLVIWVIIIFIIVFIIVKIVKCIIKRRKAKKEERRILSEAAVEKHQKVQEGNQENPEPAGKDADE